MKKTVQDFLNSFYEIDGISYTKGYELIEEDEDIELFNEAIKQFLRDGQIKFVYIDETKEEGMLLYKSNNKVLNECLFLEEGLFIFNAKTVFWMTPEFKQLNIREFEDFAKNLNDYIQKTKLPIQVKYSKTQIKILENPSYNQHYKQLSPKEVKVVKAMAYFWRFGWLVLTILITYLSTLIKRDQTIVLSIISVGIIIYGIYYGIGAIFKVRHIYCAYQHANHLEMTPNDVNWYSIKRSDKIGIPIIFIGLGLALLFYTLLK